MSLKLRLSWIVVIGALVTSAGFIGFYEVTRTIPLIPAKRPTKQSITPAPIEPIAPLLMADLEKCIRVRYYRQPDEPKDIKVLPDRPDWFIQASDIKIGDKFWTYNINEHSGSLYFDEITWASRTQHARTDNEYRDDSPNFHIHLQRVAGGVLIDCDRATPFVVHLDDSQFSLLKLSPVVGMFHGGK